MMLGYEATLTPLEKGAYLFELALIATDGGVEQRRTVRREVVELVAREDLEMTFVGCVVTHVVRMPRGGVYS